MVSSEAFASLGNYTWKLTYKWARYSHPNKPARWVTGRYYGKFCQSRDDKWVFGDRETGGYLLRHSWTSIRRHVMVKDRASPDDPDLAGYWEDWWLSVTRQRIPREAIAGTTRTPPEGSGTVLVLMHASCHRAAQTAQRRNPALQPATP